MNKIIRRFIDSNVDNFQAEKLTKDIKKQLIFYLEKLTRHVETKGYLPNFKKLGHRVISSRTEDREVYKFIYYYIYDNYAYLLKFFCRSPYATTYNLYNFKLLPQEFSPYSLYKHILINENRKNIKKSSSYFKKMNFCRELVLKTSLILYRKLMLSPKLYFLSPGVGLYTNSILSINGAKEYFISNGISEEFLDRLIRTKYNVKGMSILNTDLYYNKLTDRYYKTRYDLFMDSALQLAGVKVQYECFELTDKIEQALKSIGKLKCRYHVDWYLPDYNLVVRTDTVPTGSVSITNLIFSKYSKEFGYNYVYLNFDIDYNPLKPFINEYLYNFFQSSFNKYFHIPDENFKAVFSSCLTEYKHTRYTYLRKFIEQYRRIPRADDYNLTSYECLLELGEPFVKEWFKGLLLN